MSSTYLSWGGIDQEGGRAASATTSGCSCGLLCTALPTSPSSAAASFKSPSPSPSVSSGSPSVSAAPGPPGAAAVSSDSPVSPAFSVGDSQALSIASRIRERRPRRCHSEARDRARHSSPGAYFLSSRGDDITSTAPRRVISRRSWRRTSRLRFNSDLMAVGRGKIEGRGFSLCIFHAGKPAFVNKCCAVYRRVSFSFPPFWKRNVVNAFLNRFPQSQVWGREKTQFRGARVAWRAAAWEAFRQGLSLPGYSSVGPSLRACVYTEWAALLSSSSTLK